MSFKYLLLTIGIILATSQQVAIAHDWWYSHEHDDDSYGSGKLEVTRDGKGNVYINGRRMYLRKQTIIRNNKMPTTGDRKNTNKNKVTSHGGTVYINGKKIQTGKPNVIINETIINEWSD